MLHDEPYHKYLTIPKLYTEYYTMYPILQIWVSEKYFNRLSQCILIDFDITNNKPLPDLFQYFMDFMTGDNLSSHFEKGTKGDTKITSTLL